jgi:G protein-coupled receptor GPR1
MKGIETVLPHSAKDAYVQRVLVITSASLSIASGITVLIWWYIFPIIYNSRHEKKKKRIRQFRHDLTLALITIDLFKAIILITYPIRFLNDHQLSTTEVYDTFCDVVGFLTVATMQASDFAILALAIHTALLIFRPNFTGGLYRFRYYIYSIFFVAIPLIFASLGMVQNAGYTFFSSWCYLVVRPLWYSLVLSWIPRLFIMFSIISIYLSIFIYVKVHMYNVSKAIWQATQIQNSDKGYNANPQAEQSKNVTFLGSIQHVFRMSRRASDRIWRNMRIYASFLPGLSSMNPLLDEQRRQPSTSSTLINSTNSGTITLQTDSTARASTITEDFQAQMNRENVGRFNHRRHIIERQVNSIFIYPLAYVVLYIFPLAQQCLYYMDDVQHKLDTEPVFWLALVASWMKPFNCCVNTLVFVIREGAIPCIAPQRYSKNLHNFGDDQNDRPTFAQGLTDEEQYYSGADVEIDYVIKNQENTVSPRTKTALWQKFRGFFIHGGSNNNQSNDMVISTFSPLPPQEQNSQLLFSKIARASVDNVSTHVNRKSKVSLDWSHLTRLPAMPERTVSMPARAPPVNGLKCITTINTGEILARRSGSSSNQCGNITHNGNNNNNNNNKNDNTSSRGGSNDNNDNNDSNDHDNNDREIDLKEFLALLG